jgi:hypothetical protein
VTVGQPEDVEIAADPDSSIDLGCVIEAEVERCPDIRALGAHTSERFDEPIIVCGDVCSEIRHPTSVTGANRLFGAELAETFLTELTKELEHAVAIPTALLAELHQ